MERGVYFDIRGEHAGFYTLMLMCGRTPSLSNLTTLTVHDFELTLSHIIENAMGRVRSETAPVPAGALPEIIRDAAIRFECSYLAGTLENVVVGLATNYCLAQGLEPATSTDTFWNAITHAVRRERGAFARPWLPDVPGSITLNPSGTMPEEFWKELGEHVEQVKAEFGPMPAQISRAEQLDDAEEQEVAEGIYGYPMLSGLLLLVIAALDLHHSWPGERARPAKRGKEKRRRHWASENLASRMIENWTILEQLSKLGYRKDVNETTLKVAFTKWKWLAPLWAAAIVEADCWDQSSAPVLSDVWLQLKYDILPQADRRVHMFQVAKWFTNFAADYQADRAREKLIPHGTALRLPETLEPKPPKKFPQFPEAVLNGSKTTKKKAASDGS